MKGKENVIKREIPSKRISPPKKYARHFNTIQITKKCTLHFCDCIKINGGGYDFSSISKFTGLH